MKVENDIVKYELNIKGKKATKRAEMIAKAIDKACEEIREKEFFKKRSLI